MSRKVEFNDAMKSVRRPMLMDRINALLPDDIEASYSDRETIEFRQLICKLSEVPIDSIERTADLEDLVNSVVVTLRAMSVSEPLEDV